MDQPVVDGREPRPLSPAQMRLWLVHQGGGDPALYNVALKFGLEGSLDTENLVRALHDVARRHEIFRTTLGVENGEPHLIIAEAADFPISLLDAPASGETEERFRAFAGQPFKLHGGPLTRLLLRMQHGHPVEMLLSAHHIIFDGASIGIWMEDIATAYRGDMLDDAPSASMLQILDAAAMTVEQRQDACSFWHERLRGEYAAPELGRHASPGEHSLEPTVERPIPAALWRGVEQLARAQRVTPFAVMLAAWGTHLARRSDQSGIIVGVPFTLRHSEAHRSVLGYFVNTLPFALSVARDASFEQLLSDVWRRWLETLPHAALPFEDIVAQAARGAGEALVRHMFVYQSPVPTVDMGDDARLRFAGELHSGKPRFDTALVLDFASTGPILTLDYDPALFPQRAMIGLLDGFLALLGTAIATPDHSIGALPTMTLDDRASMIAQGRATPRHVAAFPLDRFIEQAKLAPDRVAIESAGEHLTYDALHARSLRLARRLVAQGIGQEDRVIIAMPRGIGFVVALLAVMAAGAAAVPFDVGYPDERLAFQITDSGANHVVTDATTRARVMRLGPSLQCFDEGDAEDERTSETPAASPDALAYIVYTSGSTGRPKGVAVGRAALANLVAAKIERFAIEPSSRVLQYVSVAFDVAISDVLTTLAIGATLVIRPDSLLGGPDLADYLAAERISVAVLPASVLASMPATDLPLLRSVVAGGEACSRELVDRWGSERHFVNAYGPSEMTICATTAVCTALADRAPPIGRPIPGDCAHVLDAEMEPVAPGGTGELYLGGAGLARGYLHPRLTAERFLPDPFSAQPGQRLYRTGDLVRRRDDGELEFVARNDAQLKIRGMRIEPAEIIAAFERLPGVAQCVVTTVANGRDIELVGYVTGNGDMPGVEAMRRALRDTLPPAMIPSEIFVLDAFPLTANGKVDIAALPRDPKDVAPVRRDPRTLTETILREIWSGVLGRVPGVEEDFFRIGGHSILAAQVTAQISERFAIEFSFRTMLENPTIALLADAVETAILADIDQEAAA